MGDGAGLVWSFVFFLVCINHDEVNPSLDLKVMKDIVCLGQDVTRASLISLKKNAQLSIFCLFKQSYFYEVIFIVRSLKGMNGIPHALLGSVASTKASALIIYYYSQPPDSSVICKSVLEHMGSRT